MDIEDFIKVSKVIIFSNKKNIIQTTRKLSKYSNIFRYRITGINIMILLK